MVLVDIHFETTRKLSVTGNLEAFVQTLSDQVGSLENLLQELKITVNSTTSYNDPDFASLLNDFDTNTTDYKQSVVQLTIDTSYTKSVSQIEDAITAFVAHLTDNSKVSAFDIVKKIPTYYKTDLTNSEDAYKLLGVAEIQVLINVAQYLQDFLKHNAAVLTAFKNRMVVLTSNDTNNHIIKTITQLVSDLAASNQDASNVQTSLQSIKTSLQNSLDTTTAQLDDLKTKWTTLETDMTTTQADFVLVFHGGADSLDHTA